MQEQSLEGYRLSPQQRHLWLLQQEAYSAAYSTVCLVRVSGRLQLDRWERAVASVVQRQEILRTTFRLLPGMTTPLQVIGETEQWRSEVEDVSGQSEAEQEQTVEQAYTAAGRQEWQVGEGPLLRIKLLRLGAEQHAIVISMPALCSDSVGVSNLVSQIVQAYDAQLSIGLESEDPIQYIIASEWQNRLVEGAETAAGREFWNGPELRSAAAASKLPWTNSFRKSCRFDPQQLRVEVAEDTLLQVEGSEAAFLLACWQVLLWRLSGLPQIVVGTAFDGRSYPELEEALGLFTRYLPLAQPLTGEMSFREVVQAAERQLSEAHEWQEYFSWEELGGSGAGNGTGRREPQYCAMAFGYEEMPPRFAVGELQCSFERLSSCVERYEVKLQCQRREQQLELAWHYDAGRLSRREIERLAQQYATLVASACASPAAPLAELEVVSAAEREELVEEWNHTAVAYAAGGACLHELFEAQVERSPAAIAVVYEGATLSYAELDQRANQVAHYLQSEGIGAESIVGILLERSLELVVCLLGVLKAGAAYLPLDTGYPEARLSYMLADAGVQLLLTEEWLLERVSEPNCAVLCVSKAGALLARQSRTAPVSRVSSANLAYVIYTSGSSGRPKGVMITHEAISNHMQWLGASYPLVSGDAVLQKTPFSFDASVWEFYAPLLAGARLVLARPGGHQDSKYLVELMQQEQISIVQVVPSLLRLLLTEAGLESCVRLRRVFSGGERLTQELAAQFWQRLDGVELINLYGPTEATIDATHRRYEAGEQWEGIGRPVANLRCYLLDEKMKLVPVGAVGELWLGGAGLARGYLQRADLTAQKFVPDQYSGAIGARLYGTGDLARYGSGGELEYVGRADGQLKVRGYRIELGEIEQRLRQHEEVQEAVVVGQGAGGGVERLVGYVVLRPGSKLQVEELRKHLTQELPDYMVPSGWVKLERLPLTASGKVDHLALPEPDHTRPELTQSYIAPGTPNEKLLVSIWSEVLGITQVGIHDNFFTLGGDSIRSIQVMALAREKGLTFSIQQVFAHQTIHGLAQQLTIDEPNSTIPVTRTEPFSLISEDDRLALTAEVEDAYPLTSLQAGMLYHMELRPAGAPVYHNVNSFHVRAQLNVPALRNAIQRVVDRHPIMRTGFELTRYSEPLQLVYRSSLIEVCEAEDLSLLAADEQQLVISRFMKKEYERAFDVAHPPLVRFSIHRRSAETFQYTLTECHAISDGWSTTSMFAEIFKYYFAQLNNEPIVEEPLPSFTFRDFVHLEHEALASAECQNYWSEKLQDCAPMRLPRWKSTNGHEQEATKHKFVGLVFRAELYEGLKRLAQLAEVPLKSVLLAVHMKVLSISCAQPEVMTALATNGRPEEIGGDRVRGLFINMVPFILRLHDGSWLELVKETFNSEREMLTYRRYPLAAIQKSSNKQRLLETAFNFVHFHSLENVVRSGRVELISSGTKDMADTSFTMNTSFTIGITSLTAPRLEMGLEYDGIELPEEQVKAIVDSYIQTMRAMCADPYASHAHLNMTHLLSEADHLLLDKATHIEELAGSFAF